MLTKSFLILHGIENHRPPAHWQFWLAAQLAEHGHQVLYPNLPDADFPRYEAWEQHLHAELRALEGGHRVVICHSLSCLLWFRAARGISDPLRPDRLLLVSPPDSARVPAHGASFRLQEFDARAVRASVTGEIRVACSDADPYNQHGGQPMYARPLQAPADVIPGGGHITPEDGYGPWPWVLQWCVREG